MTTLKTSTRTAPRLPLPGPGTGPCQTTPWTTDERLLRIEAMGKRIAGFVEYMCTVRELTTTSDEAKEKAVREFYEKMLVVERQLARIHDEFKLQ